MLLSLCFTLLALQAQAEPVSAQNTVCPVMGNKVDEKSQTVVVNGRAYRICCAPCKQKLEKDPSKYLNPDGTIKPKKKR
jgi:YHS domain-containing protein